MTRPPFRPAALAAGAAVVVLGLSACGNSGGDQAAPPAPGAGDSGKIAVVASTNVWGSVAQAVGGDKVDVQSIIDSPDKDPHEYETTPQDAAKVGQAKVLIQNGGGYDSFMEKLVESSGNKAPVIDAVQVSGLPGSAEASEHDHDHGAEKPAEGGEEEGPEFNEHVWYSFATAHKVADDVAKQLSTADPANAQTYASNAKAFDAKTDELTKKAAGIGQAHPKTKVAYTEPVPGYLLQAAKIQNVTPEEFSEAVEEGNDPPAAVVAKTLALFKAPAQAKALILNSQTQSATTDQVRNAAQQGNVPVVEMSETLPAGVTDYGQWMNQNLDALNGALGR
ncbi:metal ABC transporter solute-binding protein, Zn/Mn family [Pseudonocardia phyllosphaerae]|uniref:metal ABC transporter solute-binding protein, Zn/Mn family n=1 Tax=Pseudonocardia phyllosphaerae TaxID=3390502 RepID=UPI00397ABA88